VRWSELPPRERRAALANVHPGLTEDCLIACGRAVPELAPKIKAQKSKEDKLWVVLRYFGDEGHPQPEGPVRYGPAINGGTPVLECPRWERLPRLEDEEVSERGMGAPPKPLPIESVEKAAVRLREREKVVGAGERASGSLTYEAIAAYANLPNRDRVVQIEELISLGWDLRKSHPDFSAEPGFVRLPTPEAARQLRLR
jgi:hypothetical protein